MALLRVLALLLPVLASLPAALLAAEIPSDREARCLALIAYAEAAGEGEAGMAAVIRVVRNRTRHGAFPDDACAVIGQSRQFQPIEDQPALRRVIQDPEAYDLAEVLNARSKQARGALGTARRLARGSGRGEDPTGGALFFVNPLFMDKDKCPWFAGLKRTATVGGHVFMTHYRAGEERGEPAIDCSIAGTGVIAGRTGKLARQYAIGLFAPTGPKVASRTPTRAMLQAWKKSGELARRQAALKRQFKPDWYLAED